MPIPNECYNSPHSFLDLSPLHIDFTTDVFLHLLSQYVAPHLTVSNLTVSTAKPLYMDVVSGENLPRSYLARIRPFYTVESVVL